MPVKLFVMELKIIMIKLIHPCSLSIKRLIINQIKEQKNSIFDVCQ